MFLKMKKAKALLCSDCIGSENKTVQVVLLLFHYYFYTTTLIYAACIWYRYTQGQHQSYTAAVAIHAHTHTLISAENQIVAVCPPYTKISSPGKMIDSSNSWVPSMMLMCKEHPHRLKKKSHTRSQAHTHIL